LKVIISYPPLEGRGSPMLTQNRQFQWYHAPSYIYPVVAASAATLLSRDGFEVRWNDTIPLGWTYEQFERYVVSETPDLIAFETKTPVVRQHWRMIDRLKTLLPDCRFVLMGDHVTAFPRESLERSRVDYVITGGDYDFALLSLGRHLRDNKPLEPGIGFRDSVPAPSKYSERIVDPTPFELPDRLDDLPFIDRRLTHAEWYGEKWKKRTPFYYTMAGRDCSWGRCTFCSWTTLFPKFRTQSPRRLLDEIGYLIEEYGAREIFDDTGTFPGGGWLTEFCRGMVDRGYADPILFSCNMRFGGLGLEHPALMKKAGFRKLKMGLESANQSTLDRLNKGTTLARVREDCRRIHDAGLDIHLTVMVGYPWETRDDARRTLDLAAELMETGQIEMLQSTVVVPYPGTPLYEEAVRNDWLLVAPDAYESFDMSAPILRTPDMSGAEVSQLCADIYRTFLRPRFILRQLLRVRSVRDLDYLWRGLRAVLGHLRDFLSRGARR
jgi:anaerobic magnesium-protoporphyrin IX monomethyl ester cyclase